MLQDGVQGGRDRGTGGQRDRGTEGQQKTADERPVAGRTAPGLWHAPILWVEDIDLGWFRCGGCLQAIVEIGVRLQSIVSKGVTGRFHCFSGERLPGGARTSKARTSAAGDPYMNQA